MTYTERDYPFYSGDNTITAHDKAVGATGNAFFTINAGKAGAKVAGLNLAIDGTNLWQLLTDADDANAFSIQYNDNAANRFFKISTAGKVTVQELDITGITDGYVPYVGASGLAASPISSNGNYVGIGASPVYLFEVSRDVTAAGFGVGHVQASFSGASDRSKNLLVGFETENGYGFIQTLDRGVSWVAYNLALQSKGGNVGIGGIVFGSGANRVLAISNGTQPASSPADAVQVYAVDISGSSELRVRDEAGNITTLSPHNFSLFDPDPTEAFPWSYYSRNDHIGLEVNVDMAGAIRAIEQLTGRQFIHLTDVPVRDLETDQRMHLRDVLISELRREVRIKPEDALEDARVEVDDQSKAVSHRVSYRLNDHTGAVEEVKEPIYAKLTQVIKQLKEGVKFYPETGLFYRVVDPSEEELTTELERRYSRQAPKWLAERIDRRAQNGK